MADGVETAQRIFSSLFHQPAQSIHSRGKSVLCLHTIDPAVITMTQWLLFALACSLQALGLSAFTFTLNNNNNHHRTSASTRPGQWGTLWEPIPSDPVFSSICLKESKGGDFVEAEDLPSIQELFTKYCDKDGLMTKASLDKVPAFKDMLAVGDVLIEELNDIWDAAPKFPDVDTADVRIDVDSFVQIYRDVDDLFEEEEPAIEPQTSSAVVGATEMGDDGDEEESELETIYTTLCDNDKLISKDALKAWDEVEKLMSEGLLGEDEFNDLWSQTPKSPGSSEQLDVDGFLSFNVALDGLFEFDDDEEDFEDDEEEIDSEPVKAKAAAPKKMVEGGDLPPGVIFSALADEDYLVGMEELKYWSELQEMLSDGDLMPLELQNLYESSIDKESGKLSEEGFTRLYEEIESLFEEVDEEREEAPAKPSASQADADVIKKDLLSLLDLIKEDKEGLACGLDSTDREQRQVLNIVGALEEQASNIVLQKSGKIEMSDLDGTWEMLYSSSSAMKFNKGLSGLGGSFPNGKFAGLKQKLQASKYMSDAEYIERIEVTPSSASFDVKVDGVWDLRTSVSLFTGQPSIIVNVEPGRVTYGPTSTRADHWKSLGPMNMLDLSYLDKELRVMRGCTSSDTVFIFKRTA